jgi:hypothetical protein
VIHLDIDTVEYLHVPYRGDPPATPEIALVPAEPEHLPDRATPDWREAEYAPGTRTIRALIGADPHVYPAGTYAIKVRYELGQERPERWAGWIRLK